MIERDQISFAIWPREEIRLRWRDKEEDEGGEVRDDEKGGCARVCLSVCLRASQG